MATFTSCVPYYYGNSRNHREERNHDRGERNNRDHDRGDDDGDH